MNSISKPDIVDLLRIADHNRWFMPRIRYASVRSKPDLLADLKIYFSEKKVRNVLYFLPKRDLPLVPDIRYHLKQKQFLFDGKVVDVVRVSREKPKFEIVVGKVIVSF